MFVNHNLTIDLFFVNQADIQYKHIGTGSACIEAARKWGSTLGVVDRLVYYQRNCCENSG